MLYVGIDNGLSGGITVLDKDKKIIYSQIMPVIKGKHTEYNVPSIILQFQLLLGVDKDLYVVLEKAHPRPICGKRACFTLGFGYGVMQGILGSLKIPYEIVSPNDWMKVVFLGMDRTDEKLSIKWVQRLYPDYDWTATERSRILHDGKTDSAAIAYYAWMRNHINLEATK
jgi:hypothetical protein